MKQCIRIRFTREYQDRISWRDLFFNEKLNFSNEFLKEFGYKKGTVILYLNDKLLGTWDSYGQNINLNLNSIFYWCNNKYIITEMSLNKDEIYLEKYY